MARELKVYGYTLMTRNDEATRLGMQPHSRQCRAIVATTTKKEAAEKFGLTIGEANGFMTVTHNDRELRIALATPGQVFAFPLHGGDRDTCLKIERTPHTPIKRTKRPTYEEIMASRDAREAEEAKRKFTSEELQYMVEMFSAANNPVAASIAAKAAMQLV